MDSDMEAILVRVKSASHPSCEDVEFSCDPKATSVRQVKEKIRTLYSFHPDIADQRLIYSGHLLDDVQLLTDVFGLSGATATTFSPQSSYQHSGPYTIHLACTSKSYVSPNQRSSRNDNLGSDTSQSHPYSTQIPNPMMQDPRFGGNMQGQLNNPFEVNGNSGIPPEFYALHQLYVEQMTAYMRSWNLAYGIVGSPISGPGTVPIIPNLPNVNIPNNVPPQAAAQNVPPQVPQNDRAARPGAGGAGINAFGGLFGGPAAQGDDEENQRDLLDWAYTLSRLVLILSVVYFYSNFTRFLLVVIFTIAIALFQRRPFQQQNQDAQNRGNDRQGNNNNNVVNPPAPGAAADEPGANREAGAEPEGNANNNTDDDPNNANAAGDPAPAAPTGEDSTTQAAEANVAAGVGAGQHRFAYYRDVTWTFLTTFFTSLIPEMPQHN